LTEIVTENSEILYEIYDRDIDEIINLFNTSVQAAENPEMW